VVLRCWLDSLGRWVLNLASSQDSEAAIFSPWGDSSRDFRCLLPSLTSWANFAPKKGKTATEREREDDSDENAEGLKSNRNWNQIETAKKCRGSSQTRSPTTPTPTEASKNLFFPGEKAAAKLAPKRILVEIYPSLFHACGFR